MTTENTMTDAVPLTPEAIAEELVKASTTAQLVEALVKYHKDAEQNKRWLLGREQDIADWRARYTGMRDAVEEFLKEHIKEDDPASVSELKELADEIGFELTKEVEVTFTVEVTATLTVPLDFDEEDIQDNDFNIDIRYEGNHNDVECDEVDWHLNDFMSDEK